MHFGKLGNPIIPEKWFVFERIGLYLLSAYLIGACFYLKKIAFSKMEDHLKKKGWTPVEFFLQTAVPMAMLPSGLAWILFMMGNISFDFYLISFVSIFTVGFWCFRFKEAILGRKFR